MALYLILNNETQVALVSRLCFAQTHFRTVWISSLQILTAVLSDELREVPFSIFSADERYDCLGAIIHTQVILEIWAT